MQEGEIPVLSVGQVIDFCNELFSEILFKIEGEVVGYSLNRGKYIFFELKDESRDVRISCFMMAFNQSFPIENGMRLVVTGRPGLYQKSGQFRLTVTRTEAQGEGSLKRAFDLLQKKLQSEGLFDTARKRSVKAYVQRVGIISSRDAAGFEDFIKISFSRFSGVKYFFCNVAVQGSEAEDQICEAFQSLNQDYQLDAIVLVRGGGSSEDLHAFNSERVARAIAGSRTPVVVGVGHERDVTIADYCADIRASTPSNAAQVLLPDKYEVLAQVNYKVQYGFSVLPSIITNYRAQSGRIKNEGRQKLQATIENIQTKCTYLVSLISSLSPQGILDRGYSLTLYEGSILRSVESVKKDAQLVTVLGDGRIQSKIR